MWPNSDIWSLGSIAHVLLTGMYHLYELDLAAMQFQRKDAPMVLQNDSNFDITIRAVNFKSYIELDRNDRLTIDECLNIRGWEFKSVVKAKSIFAKSLTSRQKLDELVICTNFLI